MRGGIGVPFGIRIVNQFLVHIIMQFSTVFATNGGMSPLLAVWIPNMLFAVVALFVYRAAPK